MAFESGGVKFEQNKLTAESVAGADFLRLAELAEKNRWYPDQLTALDAILVAEPNDDLEEWIEKIPNNDGIKDRALQILSEKPYFIERITEMISQTATLSELVDILKKVPGLTGSDGQFYPGKFLSHIVHEVGKKIVAYAEEKGIEKVEEKDFKSTPFLGAVAYNDGIGERPIIPTSNLGLRAKFLELVNKEIWERDMAAIAEEIKKTGRSQR